ncbi:hypothetical protein [Priestia sp. P5]|uniref:hypothetical protein n=1 Tax=Priestia sp. P5 TaxID=2917806 RepID=UPI0024049A25|nr:hypothetical protein [Priestia sp. P5]MDG0062108.1 hypothetical protein [Priestia sp. P5]
MNNYIDCMEYIEPLEKIRHQFRPSSYRFMIAESLVYYFSSRDSSLTIIQNNTNRVLRHYNIAPVSLGFVRNVLGRR